VGGVVAGVVAGVLGDSVGAVVVGWAVLGCTLGVGEREAVGRVWVGFEDGVVTVPVVSWVLVEVSWVCWSVLVTEGCDWVGVGEVPVFVPAPPLVPWTASQMPSETASAAAIMKSTGLSQRLPPPPRRGGRVS
jgi:hypothetical protein